MPELKHPNDMTLDECRLELARNKTLLKECSECGGVGYIWSVMGGSDAQPRCTACKGTGKVYPLRVKCSGTHPVGWVIKRCSSVGCPGWLPVACDAGQVAKAMQQAGWSGVRRDFPETICVPATTFVLFHKPEDNPMDSRYKCQSPDPDVATQVAALLALRGEKP